MNEHKKNELKYVNNTIPSGIKTETAGGAGGGERGLLPINKSPEDGLLAPGAAISNSNLKYFT